MDHIDAPAGQKAGGPALTTQGRLIHWARWYDPLVAVLSMGHGRAFRRTSVELAGIRPGERVLDVGCGTGDLTLAATGHAGIQGEVVGIDASPEMIEVARRKAARKGAPARFEVALIERIPFPDSYFDVVLSSLMLHHLPGQLKQVGLVEVHRVLKPGGRLLVVDLQDEPAGIAGALIAALGHGSTRQRPGNLEALLRGAGFAVVAAGGIVGGALAYAVGTKEGSNHA
jgi:demethylmenaquinone methyltransferase/2-methoxy-6-polyprenyl-1,4-benzoquinol methylase/phosphoethanolamine N-methyltransferase